MSDIIKCAHLAIVLVFLVLCSNFNACLLLQESAFNATTTRPIVHRGAVTHQSAQRPHRSYPPAPHNNHPQGNVNHCDFQDLLNNLHDRISILVTLDEDERNHLNSIENKIDAFESKHNARVENLAAKQLEISQRLDIIDLVTRMTKREVIALKGDLHDSNVSKIATLNNEEMNLQRSTRQTAEHHNEPVLTDSKKLDALLSLGTSTRIAVNELQQRVDYNISSLAKTTSQLQRRLNNFMRRQHHQGFANTYLPPNPPSFYSTLNTPQNLMITSCAQGAATTDGILKLQLTSVSEPFYVRCDDTVYGGGWTVVMDRFNGDVNFQRNWAEYKRGFGNLAGEFFIGLEKLHALTASAVHELLIAMEDFEGEQKQARYNIFAIGNEKEFYALNLLGSYEGNAGDSLTYHAGSKFSTFDNDNDGCPDCNCAQAHSGAWWYNWCEMSNLNGKYFATDYAKVPQYTGMYWHDFHGPTYSLKSVRMMIRPVAPELENSRRR